MSRKSTILALAAVVSLGGFALSSTSASAFGHGPGGASGMRVGGGIHLGAPHLGTFHTNLSYRRFTHLPPIYVPQHRHWWWHYGWRRPYWIAPVVATGVAASYAVAPTWNRCSCLTKEYTPQGAVVFKDVCTNEAAMNPPEAPAQASELAPQPPMQQGYLQSQAPTAQ
jgi:hypothetical protein